VLVVFGLTSFAFDVTTDKIFAASCSAAEGKYGVNSDKETRGFGRELKKLLGKDTERVLYGSGFTNEIFSKRFSIIGLIVLLRCANIFFNRAHNALCHFQ
jgi:hypothetical protein